MNLYLNNKCCKDFKETSKRNGHLADEYRATTKRQKKRGEERLRIRNCVDTAVAYMLVLNNDIGTFNSPG
jgi:hypothetical protein